MKPNDIVMRLIHGSSPGGPAPAARSSGSAWLTVQVCSVWFLVLTSLAGLGSADPTSRGDLPESMAPFELRDGHGQLHQVATQLGRPVVIAFLGTECPLAELYAVRLAELQRRYEDHAIPFWGVVSNAQDAPTELIRFAREFELPFPLLKDPGQSLADRFRATRTPQVFVLDGQGQIRYSGRIDDQYGIGYRRSTPEQTFLVNALDALLNDQPVTIAATEPIGCLIGRDRKPDADGSITYATHIAEILNRRCVECHRDQQIAPFSLASYDDVLGWGEMILEVIDTGRMPPWPADPEHGSFRNDTRMSDEEKRLLHEWVRLGLPPGPLDQTPAPPSFADGWRIPQPDLVIPMREAPYEVPAEGVVDYQYFEVDPHFAEDQFVWAAEARPGNPGVVHHIIVYIKAPGQRNLHEGGIVDGYAPGSQPRVLQNGQAIRIPAGARLLFEMHYTPNGRPTTDLSMLGIKFLPAEQVRQLVYGNLAINEEFVIPPGDPAHEVTADRVLPQDMLLLNLTPHMHLRGKSFRYEAIYPDGRQEILLSVPRYDFNWQLTYELAEPKLLPRGTRIHCSALFDNSADNRANPDPRSEVRWGEQSFEEMMIGFFDVAPPAATTP